MSSPTRKPAEKAVALSLRKCIGWAALMIVIGVVLSTGLRVYLKVAVRDDCIVVSFHEDEAGHDDSA